MKLANISIKNFRLLKDINITLEDRTTVIVGRNNSGKTSFTELFEHFFSNNTIHFSLDDFSLPSYENFFNAYVLKSQGKEESIIREMIPSIEVVLTFSYDSSMKDSGPLGNFIIDLDSACTTAIASMRYLLSDGKIDAFFEGLEDPKKITTAAHKEIFFKKIKDRIPQYYSASIVAVDPTNNLNYKKVEFSDLKALLQPGFIYAQRRLDDPNNKDRDVLGKILQRLLGTAKSETASTQDLTNVKKLEDAVEGLEIKMNSDFNKELDKLLPTLSLFGYPGLNDVPMQTKTTLDVDKLLQNNTKLHYLGAYGINLPEVYNGLGTRNLIYILFQLFEFFKAYEAMMPSPGVHLVFIEEPEAHLHPQMQEVFIRQLGEIVDHFSKKLNGKVWPVQFIVTTHSSHIANEAPLEAIRYFLCTKCDPFFTKVKDLRKGFSDPGLIEDKDFLRKYLTLTRCDLFFATKAMLIEGPTERLLMPSMISIVDGDTTLTTKLSSQYISVVEVGGAYAHHFFSLLNLLELQTLIITDIDSIKKVKTGKEKITYKKCKVYEGTKTSNSCIKKWFNDDEITPLSLQAKTETEKIRGLIRISYQIPELGNNPCGRSFEDAFILANPTFFNVNGSTPNERADNAWNELDNIDKKTDFALEYAISKKSWVIPHYIKEGLLWLSKDYSPNATKTSK